MAIAKAIFYQSHLVSYACDDRVCSTPSVPFGWGQLLYLSVLSWLTLLKSSHCSLCTQTLWRKMSYIKAHYHPFLFALMSTCAIAELGLTAFLIEAGNEHHTWPSPRYHSLWVKRFFFPIWLNWIVEQFDSIPLQRNLDHGVLSGVYPVDRRRRSTCSSEHSELHNLASHLDHSLGEFRSQRKTAC